MEKPRFYALRPLSLLTINRLTFYQQRWKFLRIVGFESHPLRQRSFQFTSTNCRLFVEVTPWQEGFGGVQLSEYAKMEYGEQRVKRLGRAGGRSKLSCIRQRSLNDAHRWNPAAFDNLCETFYSLL